MNKQIKTKSDFNKLDKRIKTMIENITYSKEGMIETLSFKDHSFFGKKNTK